MVLSALTEHPLNPVKDILLKWLCMKTLFLTAIISARMVSELGALFIQLGLCTFIRIVLRTGLTFQPKVSSSFHKSQELNLPSFSPNHLHPKKGFGTP